MDFFKSGHFYQTSSDHFSFQMASNTMYFFLATFVLGLTESASPQSVTAVGECRSGVCNLLDLKSQFCLKKQKFPLERATI